MVKRFNNNDNDGIHLSSGDDVINNNNVILTSNNPEKGDNGDASLVNLICSCFHSDNGYPFVFILVRDLFYHVS